MEGKIRRRYVNLKQKGSFSGVANFRKASKLNVKKETLMKIPVYTLHHPVKKLFLRRRVQVNHINYQWAMDLADISAQSRYNNKKHFLLCVVDVFSKRAWIEPLANKSGPRVAQGLERIFKRAPSLPIKIQCDNGKEFYNSSVQKVLKANNIDLFSVYSVKKCCIAERFIRTIMGKIEKYKTHTGKKKFVDKIKDFEWLYNNAYHRSIGMTPMQVNKGNEDIVRTRLYRHEKNSIKHSMLKEGDSVLLAIRKKLFDKGYKPNFYKEVYTISSRKQTVPPVYILKDSRNNIVKGTFYKEELLNVSNRGIADID